MRQSDVYKINVPELGDRSDITVVSDAILAGEKNTIGNVQWMKATNSGNIITLTSETRTAKMSKYYNGLAVQFVSPISITSASGAQIKVDNLEAQPFTTTNDIEVGNVVCAVYSTSGFTANKMGVAVIDNLTTADSKKALSANQGKVLNEKKADKTIQVIAGNGLTGGGSLDANRTLNVASANDGITVNADNIQLNTVDNLTTASATKPLSANQGKILNEKMTTLTNVANGKLDKGSLPETIKNAKDLYDLLENNGGLSFDTNCTYIQESKQKTASHVYFDRNTKGLFECYKTAPASVVINDAQYFRDISNKANSDRLTKLKDYVVETGAQGVWNWKKYKSGLVELYGAQTDSSLSATVTVPLPFKIYNPAGTRIKIFLTDTGTGKKSFGGSISPDGLNLIVYRDADRIYCSVYIMANYIPS